MTPTYHPYTSSNLRPQILEKAIDEGHTTIQISTMTSHLIKTAVQALKEYSPCDVSDALSKFGISNGGFFPNLTQYSQNSTESSIVGPAYTVLFAPLTDPRPAVKGGYIDHIPEGSVVVIGLTKELQRDGAPYVKVNNALYGGLMSTRAQYLNANGTVVFGRIRDVNEHRALKYPVFAYGLGTTAGQSAVKVVGVQVPVDIHVGESTFETIEPDDLIIGDENGIVRIPKLLDLESILDYIPKRVRADQLVANDIFSGKPANPSQKERRAGL